MFLERETRGKTQVDKLQTSRLYIEFHGLSYMSERFDARVV